MLRDLYFVITIFFLKYHNSDKGEGENFDIVDLEDMGSLFLELGYKQKQYLTQKCGCEQRPFFMLEVMLKIIFSNRFGLELEEE